MSAVLVSIRVPATPEETFDAFADDIGLWWRPGALFHLTPRGDGTLAFDGQTRLITTLPNGQVFEIGRVTVTHRGWDTIPQEHVARHGFPIQATQGHLANVWRAGLAALAARLTPR